MISFMVDLGFTLAIPGITGPLELVVTPIALLGLLGILNPPQTLTMGGGGRADGRG